MSGIRRLTGVCFHTWDRGILWAVTSVDGIFVREEIKQKVFAIFGSENHAASRWCREKLCQREIETVQTRNKKTFHQCLQVRREIFFASLLIFERFDFSSYFRDIVIVQCQQAGKCIIEYLWGKILPSTTSLILLLEHVRIFFLLDSGWMGISFQEKKTCFSSCQDQDRITAHQG